MNIEGISPFMRGILEPSKDGGVKAPDNIITNVSVAYNQFLVMRQGHIDRVLTYASIEGMLGGNPPYDQAELEAAGLGHVTNFNNFKGRSAYEKSATGFWNLINSTEVFTKVVLANKSREALRFADTIARHFSDVVKEWDDFYPNFNLLGAQLVKFGLCPVIFPHEESPIWEVVDVSRFYIPSDSQVFISKLSNACVETVYTLQDLYQLYKKAEDGGPWNKEALGNYLLYRARVLTATSALPIFTAMDFERFVNSNSSLVNQFFTDNVRLINMYQKEYDGKISHYIFSSEFFSGNQVAAQDIGNEDFLYFVDRQYDEMEEALVIFTASPGEWNVYTNLGLGQKMFAPSQAINMLDCNIVDMSKMSSTPLVRTLATGGRGLEAIRFNPGVMTDIGPAEFVQNNLGANINQLVGASDYLSTSIARNAINSGDDPSVPDSHQGSISPSEARQRSFREFGVLKNVVAHFYNTFDKIVRRTFIHFLTVKEGRPGYEYAKEFKRRCIEDGVPPELLTAGKERGLHKLPTQFRKVYAARVAGDGSTLARIMGLESLQMIVPTFNPQQMAEWKRQWVEATMGVDYVDVFTSRNLEEELSGGASLARTEDNMMKLGLEPLFSPDNDQEAHADEHLGSLTAIIRQVSGQQMSPVDADKVMALAIPHLTQHMEQMSKAPMFYAQVLQKLQDPFNQVVRWAQLNRRNAQAMIASAMEQQKKDQAATEQVMSDAERKDFTARRDADRADFKVQKQVERSDKANETRAGIMRDKAATDDEIKRRKAETDIAVKNATAKGRTQTELLNTPISQLEQQLTTIGGSSPSTVDFE